MGIHTDKYYLPFALTEPKRLLCRSAESIYMLGKNYHLKSKKQNTSAVKDITNCVLLTKIRNDDYDLKRTFPLNYARHAVKITRLISFIRHRTYYTTSCWMRCELCVFSSHFSYLTCNLQRLYAGIIIQSDVRCSIEGFRILLGDGPAFLTVNRTN